MNIMLLFSQPWNVGGAETHVETLIKGLSDCNILLAVNEGSRFPERVAELTRKYSHLHIEQIQTRGCNIVRWYRDFKRLGEMIRSYKIDVISAQQRTAGLWAYQLSKKTNIPFVVTMHDPWHRALFPGAYAKIFPEMIVVSENLREVLVDRFQMSRDQIHFINNGVDFTSFQPQDQQQARKKAGFSHTGPLILHVSRLGSVKGAVSLALIDAFEVLLRTNPDLQLVIIGDEGPLREQVVAKAAQFNQKHGEHIAVKLFNDQIVDWYNASDLIVGEGRVAIEALACEKPLVAIRNAKLFSGAATPENVQSIVKVNFDGTEWPVTAESLVQEISKAFRLSKDEVFYVSEYIRNNLGMDAMAQKYRKLLSGLLGAGS